MRRAVSGFGSLAVRHGTSTPARVLFSRHPAPALRPADPGRSVRSTSRTRLPLSDPSNVASGADGSAAARANTSSNSLRRRLNSTPVSGAARNRRRPLAAAPAPALVAGAVKPVATVTYDAAWSTANAPPNNNTASSGTAVVSRRNTRDVSTAS